MVARSRSCRDSVSARLLASAETCAGLLKGQLPRFQESLELLKYCTGVHARRWTPWLSFSCRRRGIWTRRRRSHEPIRRRHSHVWRRECVSIVSLSSLCISSFQVLQVSLLSRYCLLQAFEFPRERLSSLRVLRRSRDRSRESLRCRRSSRVFFWRSISGVAGGGGVDSGCSSDACGFGPGWPPTMSEARKLLPRSTLLRLSSSASNLLMFASSGGGSGGPPPEPFFTAPENFGSAHCHGVSLYG